MSVWVEGVVERTYRCSTLTPATPGVVQAQVRVVMRQHLTAGPRVHALLACGYGDAGEQAATLLRRRLKAGRTCTAHGKWVAPLEGSMDLLLVGCHEVHTEEATTAGQPEAAALEAAA